MQLIMFDMDGTLTDSVIVDDTSYILAVERATGLKNIIPEWESYAHASSSGCLDEMIRRHRGHPPTVDESRAVQRELIAILDELARGRQRVTTEISGAAACVRAVLEAGHAVAIASGDWEATARVKLTSARIPFERLPSAFCDVSHVRTEIMRVALARARAHHGGVEFERIVYIGDGPWDVRACRELQWPLVGIGRDAHAQKLLGLGVSHVVPDFTQLDAFLALLAEAGVPRTVA